MAKATKLVVTAVGPYTTLGEGIVKACIDCHTHYVDITGEVDWVLSMREKYSPVEKNLPILCSFAGYNCIPMELSIYMARKELLKDSVKLHTIENIVSLEGTNPAPRGTLRTTISKMNNFHKFGMSLVTYVPTTKDRIKTAISLLVWMLPRYSSSIGEFTVPHFMGWCNIPVVRRSFEIEGLVHDRMALPSSFLTSWYTGYGFIPIFVLYSIGLTVLPFYGFVVVLCILFPSLVDLVLKLFDKCAYRVRKVTSDEKMSSAYTNTTMYISTTSEKESATVKFRCQGDAGIVVTALLAIETSLSILELSCTKNIGGFTTPAVICGDELITRLNDNKDIDCSIEVIVNPFGFE